jgi:hypothetical protein
MEGQRVSTQNSHHQIRLVPAATLICIALIFASGEPALAQDCYSSSISKPTPFMGNSDELFQLTDGSIWQVKYEYDYLYEYYPEVVICPSMGKLIIKGKQLNVEKISAGKSPPTAQTPSPPKALTQAIQSRIDGDFEGWDGEKIYKLSNGQIWQQIDGHYHYHFAYAPEVIIYAEGQGYKMKVMDDDDQSVAVRQLR